MQSESEAGLPSQHKLLTRSVRRNQHKVWSEAYALRHGLEERPREVIEERVFVRLQQELAASELLLALFSTALASSRRSTLCDPFPSFLMSQSGPLYEETLVHIQNLPPLCRIAESRFHVQNMALVTLKLLDWIINSDRDGFTLASVPVEEYIRRMSGLTTERRQQAFTKPTYVFELLYSSESDHWRAFEEKKAELGVMIGHHGSALENFHSIARFGLCDSFGRTSSIFGEGIYLSQDREVAYSFVKRAAPYHVELSTMGSEIGLLTASEVLLHPQEVRHSGSPVNGSSSFLDASSQRLPPGYIVSSAAAHVITRYLLVYCGNSALPRSEARMSWLPSTRVVQCILVLAYLLLLLGIWYFKGKTHRLTDLKRFISHAVFGR